MIPKNGKYSEENVTVDDSAIKNEGITGGAWVEK